MKIIHLRPHHLTCTFCFRGKGYSPEFIKNLYDITDHLKETNNPDIQIKIVDQLDDVCKKCPRVVDDVCEEQKLVIELDDNHRKIYNVKSGDILTCQEAHEKVLQMMTLEKFHQACAKCSWYEYGICEDIIKNK